MGVRPRKYISHATPTASTAMTCLYSHAHTIGTHVRHELPAFKLPEESDAWFSTGVLCSLRHHILTRRGLP